MMCFVRLDFGVCALLLASSLGCASLINSPKSDTPEPTTVQLPETVGELTRPHGLGVYAIESVALVTGLSGTGSDPPPSPQRQALLEEMKKRKVENPNQILASPSTSVALVRAVLPPGLQKGDRIDVDIRVPGRSKTSSLEGGWLMETKLREVAILDQSIRSGHVRGAAQGPVLVDSWMNDDGDSVSEVRGRILGGGVATKSRPFGLQLRSDHHSVSISKLVGNAINARFDTYVRGRRQGAATPKTDKFIELTIHPRYRNNLVRYRRVVEQIKLRETPEQRLQRLQILEGELLVPATSGLAALKLEAIGEDATATLQRGLESPSPEVRFYSAEALAYLDISDAGATLADAAQESAFRARALLALGAMSSVEAHDALTSLLHMQSAETRYGAFRALQNMNPRDPMLGEQKLGDVYLHEIASNADPMVHVSKSRRPEIVLFGSNQPLLTPIMVLVGKSLVIRNEGPSRIKVTRYSADGEDESRICTATVNDLVRGLVAVESTYPEIVKVLHEAKKQGSMSSRLAFDALPKVGRTYERGESTKSADTLKTPDFSSAEG